MRSPTGPTRWTRSASSRWWLPRIVLGVTIGLAIALGLDVGRSGGPRLWLARHGVEPAYEALGRRIDIGAAALYLDCRGHGSPTVVLEAGMGSGADGWGAVLPELASLTRTCAYDRLGRGRSDPGQRPDIEAATADLAALLAAAGEPGPFVVVGHSLGADLARAFAAGQRERTLGLALLDGFVPDLFEDQILPEVGPFADEYAAGIDALWSTVGRVEGYERAASETTLRTSDLRGLPIEVILAPRAEPRLDAAANARIEAARRAGYEALSPGHVRITIAAGSGHLVQLDRPDLVVAAVRRLVEGSRSG